MQDYNEVETLKKENQDSQMPGSENGNISKEIRVVRSGLFFFRSE